MNFTFAETLRRLIGLHDLDQAYAARLLGVTEMQLRDWLAGRESPDYRAIEAVSLLFGIRHDLIEGEFVGPHELAAGLLSPHRFISADERIRRRRSSYVPDVDATMGSAEVLDWLGYRPTVTALYPSSGGDTKPFTFLHPANLERRVQGIPADAAPTFFVFVDRRNTGVRSWADRRTKISVTSLGRPSRIATLLGIDWHSRVLEQRRYIVLNLREENDFILESLIAQNWSPNVFIGVRDGCAFGGNHRCINDLTQRVTALPPRYWVTDHIQTAPGEAQAPHYHLDRLDGHLSREGRSRDYDWRSASTWNNAKLYRVHEPVRLDCGGADE